jgi:hypothetical protein
MQNKKVILQALLSGEDCVAVLPTGYGKPELSILNFPVRGSGDLIRQLKLLLCRISLVNTLFQNAN